LFIYSIASFSALFAHSMTELMIVRFIEGLTIASVSIGCRLLVLDNLSGHRYSVAILYTSAAYGAGPVIGPYIGGLLQQCCGWKANFFVFGLFGILLVLFLLLFIKESLPEKKPFNFHTVIAPFFSTLKHKIFLTGVVIGGLIQISLMFYPTVGPFIIENTLHYTFKVYSHTALIVGCGYLSGTLLNRLLLKHYSRAKICDIGFIGLMVVLFISFLLCAITQLNLFSITLPILLLNLSSGFIYPNILASNLQLFSKNGGIALATQTSLLMLIGTLGLFLISHFHITNLWIPTIIYVILILLKASLFYGKYRKLLL